MNSVPPQFFAHSLRNRLVSDWVPLLDHLERVAKLAAQFAAKFGARAWGRQLGLWHDSGKYNPRFQEYLPEVNGFEIHLEEKPSVAEKVPHAAAGAKHATQELQGKRAVEGWLLAYAIAGHHAGLPDGVSETTFLLARSSPGAGHLVGRRARGSSVAAHLGETAALFRLQAT